MKKAIFTAALAIVMAGCTAQPTMQPSPKRFVGYSYRQILKAERVDGVAIWAEGELFDDPEQCAAQAEGTKREVMKELGKSIKAWQAGEQALPPFRNYDLRCEKVALYAFNPDEFPVHKAFPADMPQPHWVEED